MITTRPPENAGKSKKGLSESSSVPKHTKRKGFIAGIAILLAASCGYPIVPLDYLIEEQDAVSHMTLVKEVRITDLGGLAKPWSQGIEAGNWPLLFPDPKSPAGNAFLILSYGEADYNAVRDLTRMRQPGIYVLSLVMDPSATSVTYKAKALNDRDLDLYFVRSPVYDTRSEFLRYFPISSAGQSALGIVGPQSSYLNNESVSLRVVEASTHSLSPEWDDSRESSSISPTTVIENGINALLTTNSAFFSSLTPSAYGAYPAPPAALPDGSVRYGDLSLAVQASPSDLYTTGVSVDPVAATQTESIPITVDASPNLVGTIVTGSIPYGFFAVDIKNDRWFASRYFPESSQYSRLSWLGNGTSNTQIGSWPIVRALGDGTVMRLEANSWAPVSFDSLQLPLDTANARYKTGGLTFLYEYQKDGEMYLMFNQSLSVPTPAYNALVLRAWSIKRSDFLALPR